SSSLAARSAMVSVSNGEWSTRYRGGAWARRRHRERGAAGPTVNPIPVMSGRTRGAKVWEHHYGAEAHRWLIRRVVVARGWDDAGERPARWVERASVPRLLPLGCTGRRLRRRRAGPPSPVRDGDAGACDGPVAGELTISSP